MDAQDWILIAQLPATVDDFLGTTLHLWVATLHGIEVEVLCVGASIHTGCRTAAQTDEHARAAQLDEQCAFRQIVLVGVFGFDAAQTARQHDGLVIAAHFAVDLLFEGAEVASEVRTTEFIVECRATEWAVDHDLQRGRDTTRLADGVGFPRLYETGDVQVGDGETGETCFGLGACTRCTFVTDLAAATGGRTREWRDGGRVVVRLHLHQDVGQLFAEFVCTTGTWVEALDLCAFDDG